MLDYSTISIQTDSAYAYCVVATIVFVIIYVRAYFSDKLFKLFIY
jgi:hypothetical protein